MKSPHLLLTLLLLLGAGFSLAATPDVLKVSVLEVEGFSMLDGNGKWFGLVPDLVHEIGRQLNFVPNFTLVSDGRYGAYEESTGNWTGLIGEVVNKKVAFAAAPLTATSLRELHVDFSQEFLDTGLAVLIKKPEWSNPIARSATFFIGVFDAGVWCAVIVVFILTSFCIFANDRYNPREFKAREAEQNSRSATLGHSMLIRMNDFSLFGSMFYVVSTGCFQGYRRAPQSLVGRSLSIFWWIFACIFAATYVAGFLCQLVASRGGLERQFPMQDIPEMSHVDSASFKGFLPVWLPHGSTDAFFKNTQEPVFQMFYKQYQEGLKANSKLAKLSSIEDLLQLIKTDGKYFGVIESVMADYYSRATGCEVLTAGSLLNDRSYAFAFPHGSSFTRRVNEVLLRLRESGFVRMSYRKHFLHDVTQCNHVVPPASTVAMSLAGEEMARMFHSGVPVTLRSFSGPILFYFVSLLLSGVTVLADIYIFTRYERYKELQYADSSSQPLEQGNQPFNPSHPEQPEQEPEPPFGTLTFSEDQQRQGAGARNQPA